MTTKVYAWTWFELLNTPSENCFWIDGHPFKAITPINESLKMAKKWAWENLDMRRSNPRIQLFKLSSNGWKTLTTEEKREVYEDTEENYAHTTFDIKHIEANPKGVLESIPPNVKHITIQREDDDTLTLLRQQFIDYVNGFV